MYTRIISPNSARIYVNLVGTRGISLKLKRNCPVPFTRANIFSRGGSRALSIIIFGGFFVGLKKEKFRVNLDQFLDNLRAPFVYRRLFLCSL